MKKVKTFNEYMRDPERITPEERETILFEKNLILKMVEARESQGLSQRDLAAASGIKQPAIARVESLQTTPQINTLIRLLVPLGFTLDVVPIKK